MPSSEAKKPSRRSVRGLEVLAGHGRGEFAGGQAVRAAAPATRAVRGRNWARPFRDRLCSVATCSMAVSRLVAERAYRERGTRNPA